MLAVANLAKIKNLFSKILKFLNEHSFLAFLTLFIIGVAFGALVFYKYYFLVLKKEPQMLEKIPLFKEKDYQNILNILQEREKNFGEADSKIFTNPFQEIKEEVQPPPVE